ncbi:hypothetical protein [Kitasatospora sp. KL5]|uniref:hypothetical protein n=1 Tax=Kitasatospora sp. KL5 TaxID=3425125 RepID=UPI003D6FC7FD
MVEVPVPAMVAALTSIVSLGVQCGEDPWSDGWNEALKTIGGLVEAALGAHLPAGPEGVRSTEPAACDSGKDS